MRADLVTYNTLLKACMRSANLPCAEVIMSQLRQHGLKVCSLCQYPEEMQVCRSVTGLLELDMSHMCYLG